MKNIYILFFIEPNFNKDINYKRSALSKGYGYRVIKLNIMTESIYAQDNHAYNRLVKCYVEQKLREKKI